MCCWPKDIERGQGLRELWFWHATFDFSWHVCEEVTKWPLDIKAGTLRNGLSYGDTFVSHLHIYRWCLKSYVWMILSRKEVQHEKRAQSWTHKQTRAQLLRVCMPTSAFILLPALPWLLTRWHNFSSWLVPGSAFALSIISSGDSRMLFLVFVLKWFDLFPTNVSLQRLSWRHDTVHPTTQKAVQCKEPEKSVFKFWFCRFCALLFSSIKRK